MLKEIGLMDAKLVNTPLETSTKLEPNEGELLQGQSKYRKIVEKLILLSQDNLSFVVSVTSRYMKNTRTSHWKAVVRILRYLKKYPSKGVYAKSTGVEPLEVQGFIDSN